MIGAFPTARARLFRSLRPRRAQAQAQMSTAEPTISEGVLEHLNSTEDGSGYFNYSVTKLGTLFNYPSRVFARAWSHANEAVDHMDGSSERPNLNAMPGPWNFMTSSYALGLFTMVLLMNRITNIVVPPRNPDTTRTNHRFYRNLWARIYHSILPLNLSSALPRFLLRLPSLYFLIKALTLWTIILLQVSHLLPSSSQWRWIRQIDSWGRTQEMEDICWSTFAAVCGALCSGALIRGLEGYAPSHSSPFNLFGYAFLLHVYSSPMLHSERRFRPSRPDVNVIITIIIPLLQVTMLHALGISRRWGNRKIIPTAICSLLTLAHFHIVLWGAPMSNGRSYPLINYLPCLFESALVVITIVTILLNALTQILLEGEISRPLFGHASVVLPRWDEDFSVALLRLGTASLEATSVAGLGNEVGSVSAPSSSSLTHATRGRRERVEYGTMEMNRHGITSFSHAVVGQRKQVKYGFANEIRTVKAAQAGTDHDATTAYHRRCMKYGTVLWTVLKGCWRWGVGLFTGKPVLQRRGAVTDPDVGRTMEANGRVWEDRGDVYERFLHGETLSDDEVDYSPTEERRRIFSETSSNVSDEEEEDEAEQGASGETVDLYADLSSTADISASAPLLLAHMTNPTSSPLTRRRYSRLVSGQELAAPGAGDAADLAEFVRERRAVVKGRGVEDEDEYRRDCVICTVEPRQIICWPCRCLALCDDCRENLATRSAATHHTCPCCRTNVEGYSRIFIP